MKKIVLSLFLLAGTFTVSAAQSNFKIGVIDVSEVIKEAPQRQVYLSELQNEFATRKNELIKLGKELQEQEEKLKRDAEILSSSERQELETNIVKRSRNLKRIQDDFQEDIALREREKMQSLYTDIGLIVDKVAQEGQYDLVIRREAAPFYISDRVDMTQAVIKAMKQAKGESS